MEAYLGCAVVVEVAQGVPDPVFVITLRKVFSCVGTPRLLPLLSAMHRDSAIGQQVFQLHGLHQVCVPDHATVFKAYVCKAGHDIVDLLAALLQGLLRSQRRSVRGSDTNLDKEIASQEITS